MKISFAAKLSKNWFFRTKTLQLLFRSEFAVVNKPRLAGRDNVEWRDVDSFYIQLHFTLCTCVEKVEFESLHNNFFCSPQIFMIELIPIL